MLVIVSKVFYRLWRKIVTIVLIKGNSKDSLGLLFGC